MWAPGPGPDPELPPRLRSFPVIPGPRGGGSLAAGQANGTLTWWLRNKTVSSRLILCDCGRLSMPATWLLRPPPDRDQAGGGSHVDDPVRQRRGRHHWLVHRVRRDMLELRASGDDENF